MVKGLEISETDKAYLAGLIDGDGCIKIHKRKHGGYYHYGLEVDVSSDSFELLDGLRSLTGIGSIWSGMSGSFTRKVRHRWIVCSLEAAKLLEQLLPYFRLKHQEAELGVAFQHCIPRIRGKHKSQIEYEIDEMFYRRCRELKKEGVSL